MAGATLRVAFEPGQVGRAMLALQAAGRDPTRLLRAIGTGLLRNTQDRFDAESAPDGTRWQSLNPWYLGFKRGPGILRGAAMRGGLQGSLTMDVERGVGPGGAVIIGSNKIYAAVHQFGATIRPKNPGGRLAIRDFKGNLQGLAREVTIPARPYLGLSLRDEETIAEATEDYLDAVLGRA